MRTRTTNFDSFSFFYPNVQRKHLQPNHRTLLITRTTPPTMLTTASKHVVATASSSAMISSCAKLLAPAPSSNSAVLMRRLVVVASTAQQRLQSHPASGSWMSPSSSVTSEHRWKQEAARGFDSGSGILNRRGKQSLIVF